MNRKNLSASSSAQNILRPSPYTKNDIQVSKTIPKPRYESSQENDDFYSQFFRADAQTPVGSMTDRGKKTKKKTRKSRKSKFKKKRYQESSSSDSKNFPYLLNSRFIQRV